jgi:signal transduction histidine kinase
MVLGIVGLVFIAPWATFGLLRADAELVRWLLGPPRHQELARQFDALSQSRDAAVGQSEAERRRIARDLHDGAQQHLVALAMDLGRARERFETDPDGARALVEQAHEGAKAALADLRDLTRGIHPAVLADRGLDAALSSVVTRCPVPVSLLVDLGPRPPAPVESAAYFVVAEALTNVAKHAGATRAQVTITGRGDRVVVEVTDDGRGGARISGGSGLAGLFDRATALGGTLRVDSPLGGPTRLVVELPCVS